MKSEKRWLYPLLTLPMVLVALLFVPQFDGLYGQDSFAYYNFAIDGIRPNLLRIDQWPAFFWPPGYSFFAALTSIIVGKQPLAGQLVSIISGATIPIFTALFAREVWPSTGRNKWHVPLIAGLLAAGSGQLWQSSLVVMSDAVSLAFGTFSMWMVARYGKQQTAPRLWLATAAMSLAVLSRWAYPLVAIPCTIYTVWAMRPLPRKTAMRHIALAGITVIVILAPLWVAILQQKMFEPADVIAYIGDLQKYGWNPVNALNRVHETNDGVLRYALPNGIYYATSPAHPLYFGPLLALFGLPGLWFMWQKRSRDIMLLLLAWIGLVMFFHVGAPHQNFRFTLVFLPPAAILVAVGLVELCRKIPQKSQRLLALYCVVGYGWALFSGYTNLQQFVDRFDRWQQSALWTEMQTPDNATLLTFDITLTAQHYTSRNVIELFYLSDSELKAISAETAPLYLLLDLNKVETQWLGKAPSNHYHWLRDNVGLREVGESGGFTLFEVMKQNTELEQEQKPPIPSRSFLSLPLAL